jgi:phage N-6-adenine-methyltransferase
VRRTAHYAWAGAGIAMLAGLVCGVVLAYLRHNQPAMGGLSVCLLALSWIAAQRGQGGRDAATNRVDYGTPPDLFAALHREFRFTLDVCAIRVLAKCERFFSPADDGLKQRWRGRCWMNPPYNRTRDWIRKAWEESQRGALVVSLIFARTNTNWWRDYVMRAQEVRFLPGKVRFLPVLRGKILPGQGAPMPSVLVVFRPRHHSIHGPIFRWWEWPTASYTNAST